MSGSPVVVIGYGNPSRGDDALGPEFIERIETCRDKGELPPTFDTLTDFQLQIEHALDLQERQLVLFVDAGISATPPFEFTELRPMRDQSHSTHAISPAAVLEVFSRINGESPPPAFLLTIPGYGFELGSPLSPESQNHLLAAIDLLKQLLRKPDVAHWRQHSATNSCSAAS
ncbi:MAG: hydrogenase maturation protease [Candidatus Sedimenticola sp. 6PFRAG5]